MSPIISQASPSKWVTYTVKVSEKIDGMIQEYAEIRGLTDSRSEAVRELIGIGLGTPQAITATMQANADSKALARLSDALDDALIAFREAE